MCCVRHSVLTAIVLLTTCPMVCATTVGYWRFAEGLDGQVASGSGTILDASGAGNHGTPFGGPVYQGVANPGSAMALDFDGSNDRIFVPDDPLFELTQSLTLEAFVRVDAWATFPPIWMQIIFRGDLRGGSDPYFLALDRTTGKLHFHIAEAHGVNASVESPSALPLGIMLHVAGTLDDTTGMMRLFINGGEVASTTTTIRPTLPLLPDEDPGLGIGNLQTNIGQAQYFNGIIDDVRLSDRALAPHEFLHAGGMKGDVNGDGIVNVGDLALVGAQWNTPGAFPSADIDFNGTVKVGDLGIVAANWTAAGGGSGFGTTAMPAPTAVLSAAAMLLLGVGVRRHHRATICAEHLGRTR